MNRKEQKEFVRNAIRFRNGKYISKVLKRYWKLDKRSENRKNIVLEINEIFGD